MANELGPFPEPKYIIIFNPDDMTQVWSSELLAWANLADSPNFWDCVVSGANQYGELYIGSLPSGFDPLRTYPIWVYSAYTASGFTSTHDEGQYFPEQASKAQAAIDQAEVLAAIDGAAGNIIEIEDQTVVIQ